MSRIVSLPTYRQMTVRNWRNTTRLLAMLDEAQVSRNTSPTQLALSKQTLSTKPLRVVLHC